MPYPYTFTASPQYGTANSINQFMIGQSRLPYQWNLPLYGQNLLTQSRNTAALMRGEVPLDVVGQLQRRGAERGIAMGSPGSPNANSAWLRALGLTSLGLQQQGSQQFGQQLAATPIPELFNPASLYVPERKAEQELKAARSSSLPPVYKTENFFGGIW